MNQNAFYRLRLPISFLIAIIVAIAIKSLDNNENDIIISTILLPISVLIFVWIMIYISTKRGINETQLDMLVGKCIKHNNKNNDEYKIEQNDIKRMNEKIKRKNIEVKKLKS